MKIVGQIFGLGAMISLFLIYQQESRKKIIVTKLLADLFWAAHYLCLGGTAGLITNAVAIFREIIFMYRQKHKWANLFLWPVLFIGINWILGIRTFHSIFNILPIVASTFVTISLWIDDPRLTKKISVPVSGAFMLYDFCIGSYVGIINEGIAIISIILFFIKEKGEKQNEKTGIFKGC